MVYLVPSVFSKRLFDVHLNVISQIRMEGAHVVKARDLEWWGVSGVWRGGGQICALGVSGTCQACLVSALDTGA